MTSPDLPSPIDLLLHDVNEQDLVAAAIASIRTRIPEWVPNEANIEVMIVEAAALLVGQSVYAINQLPRTVLDGLLTLYGVTRKQAVAASGTVLVTMTTSTGGWRTLPAGTAFRVHLDSGITVDLVSEAPTSSGGSLTFPVSVVATTPGVLGNQIEASSRIDIVDSLSWVEAVAVSGTFTGGTDAETDALFHTRAALFLRRQTLTLVLPDHFLAAAMEVDGVGRATVVDRWNSVSGNPGDHPGHVTVVVSTLTGSAVSSDTVTDLGDRLRSGALASLTIHIVPPTLLPVTLAVAVVVETGFTSATVLAQVDQAVRSWLSPARWPWGQRLWPNDVIGVVARVPGVRRVGTVTSPQFSTIPTPRTLPGALTLTVTETT